MLAILNGFWIWLVEGLTEACAAGFEHFAKRREFDLKLGQHETAIIDRKGVDIGRVLDENEALPRFEPPGLAPLLKGSAINIEIPSAWVLQRALNPIALQSAPFVEAFARHHIERITPWRSQDTYFHVTAQPISGNANELAVTVNVVAKRMVEPVLQLLAQAQPAKLRLYALQDKEEKIYIPVDTLLPSPLGSIRRNVRYALVLIPLAFALLFVILPWRLSSVQAESGDLDKQIALRKKVLFGTASGKADADPVERIRFLRRTHPLAVTILEALSASLPDTAYLNDFSLEDDKLRITGLATRSSDLVSALERSGHFADVTFTAATTREENGNRDRFHLEMRVLDQGFGESKPGNAAGRSTQGGGPQ